MAGAMDRLFAGLRAGSSIAFRIRFSFAVLMALLLVPASVSTVMMTQYALRYHSLIQQVNRAAALKPTVRSDVTDELWDVVAGNKPFSEGRQYAIVAYVNGQIESFMRTSSASDKELIAARRAMDTMLDYIDRMGRSFEAQRSVAENEAVLEEVRNVANLAADKLTAYVEKEIAAAALISDELRRMLEIVLVLIILLLIVTFAFSVLAQRSLSRAIREPISRLELFAGALAGGDFAARAPETPVTELQSLTHNFNAMGVKLKRLIDENRREQENLKKSELRALQAQIAPHFLYNTLDAIVWLAEAKRYGEVINITRALSDFFRISLSQGKDWIPLSEEKRHLAGYLTIQKIRYRDILDYEIDIPDELNDRQVLKLLIQPLVENAIYHGIKPRRGKGKVTVTGREEDGRLVITVRDDGAGMDGERLGRLREMLSGGGAGHENTGYGLYNVNQRIRLYYNQEQGLEIESGESGTATSLRVPLRGVGHV